GGERLGDVGAAVEEQGQRVGAAQRRGEQLLRRRLEQERWLTETMATRGDVEQMQRLTDLRAEELDVERRDLGGVMSEVEGFAHVVRQHGCDAAGRLHDESFEQTTEFGAETASYTRHQGSAPTTWTAASARIRASCRAKASRCHFGCSAARISCSISGSAPSRAGRTASR